MVLPRLVIKILRIGRTCKHACCFCMEAGMGRCNKEWLDDVCEDVLDIRWLREVSRCEGVRQGEWGCRHRHRADLRGPLSTYDILQRREAEPQQPKMNESLFSTSSYIIRTQELPDVLDQIRSPSPTHQLSKHRSPLARLLPVSIRQESS